MNKQFLKALSFFCGAQRNGKYVFTLFSYPNRNTFMYQTFSPVQKLKEMKVLTAVKLNSILQQRNSNTDSSDGGNKKKPNYLMNFEPVMRPKIFLTLKNWVMAKFILQPYLDKDFTLKDFTLGAKQAIGAISSFLTQGDFQSLKGLVSDDAINEIKRNFSSLNVKERQDLFIKVTDILFAFPYQIGIIFDDSNQKRFAEITVVYHCLNDFEELKAQGKVLVETPKQDIKICNYRFIREYTKGVESDWIVNRLGHFKLDHFEYVN